MEDAQPTKEHGGPDHVSRESGPSEEGRVTVTCVPADTGSAEGVAL